MYTLSRELECPVHPPEAPSARGPSTLAVMICAMHTQACTGDGVDQVDSMNMDGSTVSNRRSRSPLIVCVEPRLTSLSVQDLHPKRSPKEAMEVGGVGEESCEKGVEDMKGKESKSEEEEENSSSTVGEVPARVRGGALENEIRCHGDPNGKRKERSASVGAGTGPCRRGGYSELKSVSTDKSESRSDQTDMSEDTPTDTRNAGGSESDLFDNERSLTMDDSAGVEGEDVSQRSEEQSVDNNTFNIINTENSESQEVSEITTDDTSHGTSGVVENGQHTKFKENGKSVSDLTDLDDSEMGEEEELELEEEETSYEEEEEEEEEEELEEEENLQEVHDESEISIDVEDDGDGDESDDECEFDHESLEDLDQTHLLEDKPSPSVTGGEHKGEREEVDGRVQRREAAKPCAIAAEVKRERFSSSSGEKPSSVEKPHKDKSNQETQELSRSMTSSSSLSAKGLLSLSPKSRRRTKSESSGCRRNKNDFTIEIFEPKRRPVIHQVTTESAQNIAAGSGGGPGPGPGGPFARGFSHRNSERSSSCNAERSPGASDLARVCSSSMSALTSVMLDVSQSIREESEESEMASPRKRSQRRRPVSCGAAIEDAATRSLAHLTEATPATAKTAAPPADLPCTASTVGTTVGGTAPAANSSSSSSTPHKSIPSSSTPTTPSTTPGDTSSLTPPSSSTSNAVAASASTGASPSGTTAPSAAKDGVAEDEAGTASTLADSSSGGSSGSTSSGSSGSSAKRPQGQPMAFTIDLGDEAGGATSDTNKKLDISDSIRKWAPRHRRNLSLTKVDENKKVEEKVGKPPMGRPRSGTVGTAGLPGAAGTRRGGYHSEGYFSSDQDDEAPRNRELKSPRSPRTPELRSPLSQTRGQVQRSSSQDSSKGVNLRMRTPSPESKGTYTMTLNESASFLIEKMMNNTPETKRKQGGKPEGRACCKDGKKPTVAQVTGKVKTEKVCKEEHNAPEEDADNVSETGTYTIEKDSSSPEVEQARQDIDRVFGVSGTESDADVALLARGTITATSVAAAIPSSTTVTSTAGVIHSSDETWNGTTESEKFKGQPSLSRSSPNWIQQWAAQVAEQTKSSTDKTAMAALGSPRGNKPPLASPTLRGLSTSQESSESRPRRILPTPPVHSAPYTLPSPSHSSPFTLPSPRGQEPSDQESPTKAGRTRGDIYDNLGKKSDSSLDTESYLRDTENLMTSLQARMDLAKTSPAGYRGSSFESHDSGGDSDLDTSTSYPISGTDERLSKVLKAKLKLGSSGDEGTKVSPVVASPRKLDPLALDTRLKMTSHFKRERSIMSDGGYEMYSSRREDHGLQSDSSSETSEPIKDARKASDNNPPLKFNRAFSLRRARLGCDDSSPSPQTPTAPDKKKKSVRPNSAGTIGSSSRRTPTGVARNEAKNTSQSNKGSAVENFLRADGGRFSLRVPKSGSTTTVSKSPSRAATKKEQSVAGRRGAPRSNSTLSAKEIDFQNWKRRKNYDPMKAAAEGRKKQGDKKPEKSDSTPPNVNVTTSDARSPSPPGSLLRSASFHGTVGLGMSATKWNRRPNHLNTSEDEAPLSLEEDHLAAPHASPLRRSPTSPHQMASPISASPAHHALNARARRSSYAHSEDGEGHHGTISRKASLDESGSEGKVSPMGTSRGPSSTSGRSKAKMEALDNLVISTIHSLSVKVRTTSENLLQKLKSQYDEEGDRAALLEAVLSHLSEGDQSLSASQSRSTSRELAGILQNLKKIGNALEVIDRVLILEDDDDLDDDDLEGTGAGDWSDRDY